jgi:hypothetical protein
MAGFIRDNGLESPFNRGTFYGCRDGAGRLEGVALIGHGTFMEARSEGALEAFARLARSCPRAHMILGEQGKVGRFWNYYAGADEAPRLFCRELLFELRRPVESPEPVPALRRATLDDLSLVVPVHALGAFAESGVNPLEVDPKGFRLRCARRIEQGRMWVWTEGARVIFKADVISETPEVIYVEGVYVDPQERGKGYGLRCLSQLARTLLAKTNSLTLLVNEQQRGAHSFFRKAGFEERGLYDTIFLRREHAATAEGGSH